VTAYKIILKTKIQTENINTSKEIISFIKKKIHTKSTEYPNSDFFVVVVDFVACMCERS
jgi:hypothetical protein